jgi:hypothetical protein
MLRDIKGRYTHFSTTATPKVFSTAWVRDEQYTLAARPSNAAMRSTIPECTRPSYTCHGLSYAPNDLLKQFTKTVLETALNEEMTEHLGRSKHEKAIEGQWSEYA